MSLNINKAKKGTGTKKAGPVPQDGVQLAVIVQVVDLGIQPGGEYKGQAKPPSRQIRMTYELPHDTHEFDGEQKPLLISETFSFSGSELSTCYKRINAIDPGLKTTNGEFANLVGKAVQVQIVHRQGKGKYEGRVFANVASVSQLMRGMQGPDETYNPQYFYSPDSHDEEVWSQMPDFLKEIIESRLDKQERTVSAPKAASNATPQGTADDAAPFDTDVSTAADADEEW